MTTDFSGKYLLDTGVWIKIRRGDETMRKFVFNIRFHGESVGYSVITEAELWTGISPNKLRTAEEHKIMLRPFKRYFINTTIARRSGELKRLLYDVGKIPHQQRPFLNDCIIMATAEFYDLVFYTTDSTDFSKFHNFSLTKTEIRYV
jgi:predicted nucleic acid-binding protein